MTNKASFSIRFEGPAVDNHEMEINELAPALVSIADLLEEANNIVNGGTAKVKVNVRGSFKSGSFGIDFSVIQSFLENMVVFLASEPTTAAVNLLTLIGFLKDDKIGLIGLIELIKRLRGKQIEKVIPEDDNIVSIEISNTQTIKADKRVLQLYDSPRIRHALEGAIAGPLEKDGIEKIITGPNNLSTKANVEIGKGDASFFEKPESSTALLGEQEIVAFLQVDSLVFGKGKRWRFSWGDQHISAEISDENFISRVLQNEEQFAADDIYKVRLKIITYMGKKGLSTKYEILEVLNHESALHRQLNLLEDDTDDSMDKTIDT